MEGQELPVQVGQADALIAGATIKQERIDSGWIFSDGYYDATQTFVVTKDSSIASFAVPLKLLIVLFRPDAAPPINELIILNTGLI